MTPNDERRLIAEARRGGSRAFASLVDANQQKLRGFLRRLTGDWAEADDLAQEAFVTAWTRLDRFDGRSSFSGWLCGIGYRLMRDGKRARGRAMARDHAWLETQDEAGDAAAASAARIDVRRALADAPVDQRAALLLCLGEGYSHAEAAAVLKMPVGTVKSHVARGRARLEQALKDTP